MGTAPPRGRDRRFGRGGIGGGRSGGRPQPARPDRAATARRRRRKGELDPNAGTWQAVGASADLAGGGALAFDLGSVNGFVHRADAKLEAVSGVCTHQGCKLWLDAPDSRLRCPCHSTSFSLEGETAHPSAANGSAAAAEVPGTRKQRRDRGFRADELGVMSSR